MPTYRSNGAWGAGTGVNLTVAQFDGNTYEWRTAIDDILANPPVADSIVSVTQSGFDLTFHTTLGSSLGPVAMPVVQFVWRGEWSALTIYAAGDLFMVTGQGIFTVMADHTSAATFDPLAVGGSPAVPLYNQIIGVFDATTTNLDDLADVDAPTPTLGQVLTWAGSPAAWRPEDTAATVSVLDDLTDVIAPSPVAGQVLRYLGGSPDAGWQPDTLTLDDLGDVAAAAPSDGNVLTYHAGSPTGWIAAAPAAVPSTLDSLTDVSAAAPADGDFLQYDTGSPSGWKNQAGTAISSLAAATLPVATASLLEISEASGSPITYASKKITIASLLARGDITLGSTSVALGATVTTLAGLTLTSPTLTGTITLPGGSTLLSPAANVVAIANDVNAQGLRIYNTRTDSSNGEWAYLGSWVPTANIATFGTDKNGTGVSRAVQIMVGGTVRLGLATTGVVTLGATGVAGGQLSVLSSSQPAIYFDDGVTNATHGVATAAGNIATGSLAGAFVIKGSSNIQIAPAGRVQMALNNTLVSIGPSAAFTSSFPALIQNGTQLRIVLADNSAFAPLGVGLITTNSATLLATSVALSNGAAAAAGTLTNAPAAGNPTKWIPINDNGTTRYIPAW